MYLGKIVETAETAALYARSAHPYTQALVSPIPEPDPYRRRQRIILAGDAPNPEDPPPGCPFHPRCPRSCPTAAMSYRRDRSWDRGLAPSRRLPSLRAADR